MVYSLMHMPWKFAYRHDVSKRHVRHDTGLANEVMSTVFSKFGHVLIYAHIHTPLLSNYRVGDDT
jgi:hypothetical protein